ncbi:MAG: hypothetical protein ACR2PO_05765 [Methyloligellaceae bacterium]
MSRRPLKEKTRASKRLNTRAHWAREIAALWEKSKGAVIETGHALIRAKAALKPGIFLEMIEQDLPFSTRSAQRFMKIASDPRLSDPAHAQFLPPAWTALYELIKLSDEEFAQALNSGHINPNMTRNDVVKLRGGLWGGPTGADSDPRATRVPPQEDATLLPASTAAAAAEAAHFLYHDLLATPGGDQKARAAMKLHTLLELELAIDDITEDIFEPMTREERSRIERRIRHLVAQLGALLAALQRSRDDPLLAYEFDWTTN